MTGLGTFFKNTKPSVYRIGYVVKQSMISVLYEEKTNLPL